jgi:hypothetical protein
MKLEQVRSTREMAKGKKKTTGRDKAQPAKAARGRGGSAARDGRAPKLDKKLGKVIDKRVRKLESRLSEAERLERKRVRALERARIRRQTIEAALDELRPEKAGAASARPAAEAPVADVSASDPASSKATNPPKA